MDDVSLEMEILQDQMETLDSILRSVRDGDLDKVWNADREIFGPNGRQMIEKLRVQTADLFAEITRRY